MCDNSYGGLCSFTSHQAGGVVRPAEGVVEVICGVQDRPCVFDFRQWKSVCQVLSTTPHERLTWVCGGCIVHIMPGNAFRTVMVPYVLTSQRLLSMLVRHVWVKALAGDHRVCSSGAAPCVAV